ncbi:MAG: hypothetical protein QE487_01855 [Fluviicola sp.]|nr:hypothetical protein [Fluviicola sp.]
MSEIKKITDLVLLSKTMTDEVKSEIIECLQADIDQSLTITHFEQNRDKTLDFYKTIIHADKLMNKDSVKGLKELVEALSESQEESWIIYNVPLRKGSYSFIVNGIETSLMGYMESIHPGFR